MSASRSAPAFHTERLVIQPHTPEDWQSFHALAADPVVMRYITGGIPFEEQRSRDFVTRQQAHLDTHGFCRWKLQLRNTGEYVGFCGAEYKHLDGEHVPEIGWWIHPQRWGQGLATEAARSVFTHLWEDIRLARLVSCAFPENLPSLRIMEKLGFTFEKHFHEPALIGQGTLRLVMYSRTRA